MTAPFTISSAIKNVAIMLAFLPVVTLIYPETAAAANPAQNLLEEKALVFEIDSKQTTNKKVSLPEKENPTLTNPCYPAPIDSCNPDTSPAQQPYIMAQAAAEKAVQGYNGKNYSKEEVEQLIVSYSAAYGINPATPLCIARLESGFNQHSKNRRSSASGVFQYLTSTWKHTDEGKSGLSIFDADANVKAAVKYMAVHKSTKPWTVKSKCPALAFAK